MGEQKTKTQNAGMDEGHKRVLGIIAGILVARHLKTTEDLFDTRDTPQGRSIVAAAVQWAERIMQKIENVTTEKKVNEREIGSRQRTIGEGWLA